MSAGLVLQAAIAGAAAGAVYGLVGLGYGLIYRMSGILNFAHGDLVSAGVFCFLLVVGGGGAVALVGLSPVLLVIGMVVALGVAASVGMLIQRAAVSPSLVRGSAIGWIGGTVAAGLLLRALVGVRFQAESYTVPETLPVPGSNLTVALPGGGVLQLRSVMVLVVAVALALGFDRWLARSRTGRGMRAVSQDEDAARLCGVSPQRVRMLAWALAGLLAALAGLLVAPSRPMTLDLGVILGLKGTAAAVLGRLGSARGTIAAGVALGVGESFVTTLSTPGLALGPLRLAQLGPFPGLQDSGPLLVLVVLLALVPGLVRDAREVVD